MVVKKKKQGCSCKECIDCCKREPGWFIPDEIPFAARFMNLTEQEFLKQFCEEHIENNVCAYSPKTKPGKKECIFLNEEGLCKIHEVKPYECKKVYGCEPEYRHKRIRELIVRRWEKT